MRIFKVAIALLLGAIAPAFGDSPWGADYFPNVPLVNQEGKTVRFFDDLIKDKVVTINFIYTTCPDSCPLETARMAEVQRILGDRVGKDIFMYSITIDPERDTPEVLAAYAKRYRAAPGWWFLTGKEADITLLRKKLGLYADEIQDGSKNHNLNLIIGNQSTGKWLKRSSFENPYVLATQIGTWLNDWQAPAEGERDYGEAPKVRNISQGEYLFRTRCVTCHTIGNGQEGLAEGLAGPDLSGVTRRRERSWLERWIAVPDQMLTEKDPIAMGLYAQYNNVPMPNLRLSPLDVDDLLRYIRSEDNRVQMQRARERRGAAQASAPASGAPPAAPAGDVVAIMNAWIREAHPEAVVNAGYMTLVNVGSAAETLVQLESPAFGKIEIHEMAAVEGLMKMRLLSEVVVPAGGGQFRFEPGGAHLMLMDPRRHLSAGETVELTLTFRSGRTQKISVSVVNE